MSERERERENEREREKDKKKKRKEMRKKYIQICRTYFMGRFNIDK